MLKNVEIWITAGCNCRCLMCHWWKNQDTKKEISTSELKKLLSKSEFQTVGSVQISGGEPMMREDIGGVAEGILDSILGLNKILLATNGTFPRKTAELLRRIKQKRDINISLCVSLDGDKETNKKNRGIDSYDSALATLKLGKETVPDVRTTILMTLTPFNCNLKSLQHIKQLAADTGSDLSFRGAYSSVHHIINNQLAMTDEQKRLVVEFTLKRCEQNPFLQAQAQYLKTGRMPMMDNCKAGNLFVNIRSNGNIYPCINSTRKIGDINEGRYAPKITDLGKYEQCPCCDEACFYPMLNWSSAS